MTRVAACAVCFAVAFAATAVGNQTYITSDGGQFRNAVTAYFASPVTMP